LRRGSIVRKTPINESVYEEGQRGNAESIQFRELEDVFLNNYDNRKYSV
jgi:hypothetical protein